jgi:soluble lytic murein transglycosylase-like protein
MNVGRIHLISMTAALAMGILARAQDAPLYQDAVRAAMAPSIEKQRQSVQQQVGAANAAHASGSFFTIPWAQPLSFLPQPACDPMPGEQLAGLVDAASKSNNLKADLVRAVISKESGDRPCAVSVKGAQGLMQLMPATAEQFGVTDPFDPKQNVEAGAKLLKQLMDKYKGDMSLALSAYNAGADRVDKDGGIPQIPETQEYVKDILGKLAK